ncbi:hypothetical protein HQ535_10050 [bacterium]|nr:hypothetical protein [bacterium]
MSTKRTSRRWARLALVGAAIWAMAAPAPAGAQVEGPCVAYFNGVSIEEIDTIRTPLELGADDVLTFFGTDELGTQSANVEVSLVGFGLDNGTTTYGPVQAEFSANLDLTDMTTYGVGLYQVTGTTDNCTVEAWLRISGRFPLTTLAGLTAAGLALGGLTAQVSAIATRGRWSHVTAGLGGIATGLGIALLGQQFGRLQLSLLSVLTSIAIASLIGFVIANLLRPKVGPGFFERRRIAAAEYRARVEADESAAQQRADSLAAQRQTAQVAAMASPQVAQDPITAQHAAVPAAPIATEQFQAATPAVAATPAPTPVPANDNTPYWGYVMAQTDVYDITDHTRIVAVLQPGKWYLARREAGGWVHIVASDGGEGWVARASVHRQG